MDTFCEIRSDHVLQALNQLDVFFRVVGSLLETSGKVPPECLAQLMWKPFCLCEAFSFLLLYSRESSSQVLETCVDTRVYEPSIRARPGNHNTSILGVHRKSLLTLEPFGIQSSGRLSSRGKSTSRHVRQGVSYRGASLIRNRPPS
jgi:hypothetical protein